MVSDLYILVLQEENGGSRTGGVEEVDDAPVGVTDTHEEDVCRIVHFDVVIPQVRDEFARGRPPDTVLIRLEVAGCVLKGRKERLVSSSIVDSNNSTLPFF